VASIPRPNSQNKLQRTFDRSQSRILFILEILFILSILLHLVMSGCAKREGRCPLG